MSRRWRVRRLREDLAGEWAELVKSEGLSPGGILRGVWAVFLGRYSGESEVLFGTGSLATRSGNGAVIESSVTMFPVRIGIADDVPASRWLRELDRSVEGGFRHAGCSESDLRRWSGMPGDLPLYESAVILSDSPVCPESPDFPGPLEVVEACGASIPLALVASVHAPAEFALVYDTSRFAGDAIERMLLHVETLLLGFLRSREEPLGTLSMLTETEEHQLLVEWNRTATDHRDERPIHELFQAQVERSRHAIALDCHGKRWSYAELDARANQVGNHLRKRGVGPEVLVGICLERSLETVVGILGILKAGGAYLPLDPAYPRERLAFMLEDTRAPILLTLGHLRERLPDRGQEVLCLDSDWPEIARESIADPRGGARCDNLAYVIYTSGSTGTPKGVAIEHRSASALIHWAGDVFSRDELAGVLFSTSICFDLSVFEMFVPLSWGGTVIMAESVLELPRLPSASGVTLVNTVPSAMTEALELGCLPDSVRTVNLAGEKLSVELVGRIYEKTSVTRVYDLFGPSEDTTYSTFALRSADGPYTIGRPIANTRVYLLDDRMRPVPIGVTGEMYLGGSGLARGYLNRPELTAERFVADPFSDDPGARLYRSGDLARYLPDGNLEFLGRADHQVKVRGYRIELGEIESALARLEGVEQAVVLAREDVPGDLRLVAYLVARGGKRLRAEALSESLGKRLPDYMLPSAFVVLDRMPLTPSGKVDRRALPAVGRERPELEREFVPPRGALQEYLAGLWRDVLKLDRVGVDDPFFALGGDSLLAARFIQRLQERLGEFIYVVTIFKAPTIAEYARLLRQDYPGSVAKTFGEQEAPPAGEPAAVPVTRAVDTDAIEDLRRRIPSHRSVSSSAAAAGKNPRAMFILSPPRSGTTLLRVMLAGHADLFSASELNLLLFDTLEERRAAFAGRHRIMARGDAPGADGHPGLRCGRSEAPHGGVRVPRPHDQGVLPRPAAGHRRADARGQVAMVFPRSRSLAAGGERVRRAPLHTPRPPSLRDGAVVRGHADGPPRLPEGAPILAAGAGRAHLDDQSQEHRELPRHGAAGATGPDSVRGSHEPASPGHGVRVRGSRPWLRRGTPHPV